MKSAFKIFGAVVLISFVLGVMGFVAKVVLFPAHVANAGVDTAYGVVDKTLNADNAIYNYEWFKKEYADYISLKNKVQLSQQSLDSYTSTLPKEREKWTSDDKNELSRLNTILLGQKQQLQDLISEYNAKSQMANRTIFKTGDLPQQLPTTIE